LNESNTTDFEDLILKRRLEDSEANSNNYESLAKHNQIYISNPTTLTKKPLNENKRFSQIKNEQETAGTPTSKTLNSLNIQEENIIQKKEDDKKSESKKNTYESETHPFFQNKRDSMDMRNDLKMNSKINKAQKNTKNESPKNVTKNNIDFDYNNYHKKIQIQKVNNLKN
jgi:hypothetical protein